MEFKKYIPNIMTYSNLLLGTIVIILIVAEPTDTPRFTMLTSILLMIAVWLDRYDGKLARLFEVETEFGKQLDSLADLVSFGIAPVAVAWKACLYVLGPLGIIPVLIFSICGATRLARYNICNNKKEYTGVPITIAGALLTLINFASYLFFREKMMSQIYVMVLSIVILIISCAMVSNIKIKKM